MERRLAAILAADVVGYTCLMGEDEAGTFGRLTELRLLVEHYRAPAPGLADWLEMAIPEGLVVFSLSERHQKRLRNSNPMERLIQQEIKRRTVKVRVFPNEASLERLLTASLVEIDEKWASTDKPYITWKSEDDSSKEHRTSRHHVPLSANHVGMFIGNSTRLNQFPTRC